MRMLSIFPTVMLALTATVPAVAQIDVNANIQTITAQCPMDLNLDLRSVPAPRRSELIACIQKANAEALNAQAPIKLDEVTTLSAVSARGTVLTYHYTIEADAASVTPEAVSGIISDTRESACANLRSIAVGAGFRYVWVDRNGTMIAETTVDSC